MAARIAFLPSLCHKDVDHPALVAFENVESGEGASGIARPVLEGRLLIQDVLDNQIDADMLQIIIGGILTRVITERKIEGIPGRLKVVVVLDEAGERPTRLRACRRGQAEISVDVRR